METVTDSAKPMPKSVIKLIQEESGMSDSGLADSKNVTFSPTPKIVEFSPLVTGGITDLDKSVMVPRNGESDSETTLDMSTSEDNAEGPFQSSGLVGTNFNVGDISTIPKGMNPARLTLNLASSNYK